MAMLYFYNGGSGGNFDEAACYWNDSGHTGAYGSTPTSSDDVQLDDFPTNGTLNASAVIIANGITINTGTINAAMSISGCATTNVTGGSFFGPFTIEGNISGGNFAGDVTVSYGTLNGGVFNSAVYVNTSNGAVLAGGTFADTVAIGNSPTTKYYAPTSPSVATANNVRNGVANLGTNGNLVLPATNNVRNSISYGANGTELTGNATFPAVADVQAGVTYGAGGTQYNGIFNSPAVNAVRGGVTYGANAEFTGTATNVGIWPNESDVRLNTAYGPNNGADYTGSCVVPAAADVQENVSVDATVGSLVIPAENTVRAGTTYGDNSEFNGTYGSAGPWNGTITRTVQVKETLKQQTLQLYQFASYNFEFVCEDANNVGIDLAGDTIKFLVYNSNSQAVLNTINAVVSNNSIVTVAFNDTHTTNAIDRGFVLRDQTDDTVLSYGKLRISPVPDVPA